MQTAPAAVIWGRPSARALRLHKVVPRMLTLAAMPVRVTEDCHGTAFNPILGQALL